MVKRTLSLALIMQISFVFADDVKLDEISITASGISSKKSLLNKSDLKRGLIWNERDLVKNETGVSVTEGGRGANNGYAIRGVESDRVSLKVDGMEAAQSFMPRFYYIKGFMNGNRNSTELENISSVEFIKGANSLNKGSGAIGGSVSMQTKTADDFIYGGGYGIYAKSGYSSRNREFKQVLGAGIKHEWLEAMAQYTYKRGKETENFYSGKIDDIPFCGMGIDGVNIRDKNPTLCSFGRILPDSVRFKTNSRLAKIGIRFNDNNFFNTFYEDYRQYYFTEEKSNSTALNRKNTIDSIPYKRYGFYYEYTPSDNKFLSYLKAQFSRQRVTQSAIANQYFVFTKPYSNLNDKLEKQRQYIFSQNKMQFDTQAISNELNLGATSHIFSFGFGKHFDKFSNENLESSFPYDPTGKITTKNFTFQEPIKTELAYLYLSDDFSVGEKLNLNLGIRLDSYHYKPKENLLPFENRQQKPESVESKRFKALSYQAGAEYEIIDDTTLGYAFSTAFRAPRVEEMYFRLKGSNDIIYERNLDLKPEKAQNHEITINHQNESFAVGAGVFYSKYSDFIDLGYDVKTASRTSFITGITTYRIDSINYKQTNISRAEVKGIELNAKANLINGFYTTLKGTYAKGKKSNGTSMMALQPLNAVLGLGYANDKLDLMLTARFVAAKKPSDAKDILIKNGLQIEIDKNTGKLKDYSPEPHKFLSSGYSVFDLTGSFKATKNISINFGIFNIFNKRYSTWENLRQLRYNGNQSYVKFDGEGLERYTAPRRNFAISVEARF